MTVEEPEVICAACSVNHDNDTPLAQTQVTADNDHRPVTTCYRNDKLLQVWSIILSEKVPH